MALAYQRLVKEAAISIGKSKLLLHTWPNSLQLEEKTVTLSHLGSTQRRQGTLSWPA